MTKAVFIFISIFLLFSANLCAQTQKVSLQFKWKHGFQFAGYYAAKEKGFYKEEGLEVEFFERDGKKHYIERVADGEREYGVTDTALLLAQNESKPLVWLTQVFQKSPLVLFSLKSSNIVTPFDLKNKRVSYDSKSIGDAPLKMMFSNISEDLNLSIKPIGYKYDALIEKKVDAAGGYISDQPFWFKQQGVDINIIDPQSYGIDFYGDNLFTSKKELEQNPERVAKMVRASLKGWQYALEHKEEIVELILRKYSKKKSKEHLLYEAKMTELLILPKLIPLGSIDKTKAEKIFEHFQKAGFTKTSKLPEGFIYEKQKSSSKVLDFSEEEKAYLAKKPYISVASLSSFPPFNFVEEQTPKGFSIDYMKELAKIAGFELRFVTAPWREQINFLKEKKIDVIPGIAMNKERKKRLSFIRVNNYINYDIGLVTRKGSSYKTVQDLKGLKVAVVQKTFVHTHLRRHFPELKLVMYRSSLEAVLAIANNEVDALIGSLPTFNYYIQTKWLSNLQTNALSGLRLNTSMRLYFGVNKEEKLLKSILEKSIQKLSFAKAASLKQKWMQAPTQSQNSLLTSEQSQYLKDKQSFKLCVKAEKEPYEKLSKNGHYEGILAEYAHLFSERLGMSFEVVKTNSHRGALERLRKNACAVMITDINRLSNEQFLLSNTFLKVPRVFAIKSDAALVRDFNEISGGVTGVIRNSSVSALLPNLYPNIQLQVVDSTKEGLQKVASGELDSFVDLLGSVSFSLQKQALLDVKIGGSLLSDLELAFLVNKNAEALVPILNKAINTLTQEDRNNIQKKWVSVKFEKGVDYTILWQVLTLTSIIVISVLYKNHSVEKLNKKLRLANSEIEEQSLVLQEQQRMVDKYILITTTDEDGIITDANEAFCKITGFTKEELIGQKHSVLRHKDMDGSFYEGLWETIRADKTWSGEIKNRKKDGSFFWVNVNIEPMYQRGKKVGYRAIREDITDKKQIEELSITDKLTGLYNRLKIDEILIRKIDAYQKFKTPFLVILLDIDDFKQVNDVYGHDIGDYVLKEVALSLKESVRATDFVGRWGGEEFVIVCSDTSVEVVTQVADKIRRSIQSIEFEQVGRKTVSVGVTDFRHKDNFSSVFKRVDEALYKAKSSGKNRVVVL